LCLERATIADRQGASEDQKFVAKPTHEFISREWYKVSVGESYAHSP
jgi:hypothetical protein